MEHAEQGFYIYTLQIGGCEHPRDYIYMPWGYSPFVDDGARPRPLLVVMATMVLLTVVGPLWCL